MGIKVVSFFIFFQELSNKKKIKALRPKMTKIASRGGGPASNTFLHSWRICSNKHDMLRSSAAIFYHRGLLPMASGLFERFKENVDHLPQVTVSLSFLSQGLRAIAHA